MVTVSVMENDGRSTRTPTDDEILLLLHDPEMANLGAELCFRKFEPICMRAASRWSGDAALVRHTALDVLSHFIEREADPGRATFRIGASITAYLVVAIHHAFLDHFRRERRHDIPIDDDEQLETQASSVPHPLRALILAERGAAVRRCLAQLPENERHILTLRYLEDPPVKFQDIADSLGIAVATASYRLEKARQHLRQILEQSGIKGLDHASDE